MGSNRQQQVMERTHEGKEHSERAQEGGQTERGGDGRIARRETRQGGTAGMGERGSMQEQGQGQEDRSMRPTRHRNRHSSRTGVERREQTRRRDVCKRE